MIKMTEYAKRRKELMQTMGSDSILILPAAKERSRNGDAFFPFRQNSDFYYLTGFPEPDAVVVLIPKRRDGEYILFNRPRDRDREIWEGPRAGQEGAIENYLADESFPIDELHILLPELIAGKRSLHYPLGLNRSFDKAIMRAINTIRARSRGGVQTPNEFVDITPTLHEMRLFKSSAEIDVMQKAVDISSKAHLRAMKKCKPGIHEYVLEAELMYEFLQNGARSAAYSSIVGAGRNTCVLHYINNDQPIADGDLVLIDAGAEYQNYASDITRTFPANGRFTEDQRKIYDLVLASQLAGIKAAKPGTAWTAIQSAILRVITEGLVDLGILKGQPEALIEKQAYFPFYMHRSGHWLGLDVHDVGRYRIEDKWRALEPGMVLTVEPGIYISADIPGVNKRWHHIGVRIEDDILITKDGPQVLSQQIPKNADDIEAIMAN